MFIYFLKISCFGTRVLDFDTHAFFATDTFDSIFDHIYLYS